MGIRKNRFSALTGTILASAFAGSLLVSTAVRAETYQVSAPPAEQELPADESLKLCNFLIDEEASMAYNQDAVKAVLAEPRDCPSGGTLRDTIVYVDKLLMKDFDDPYTTISPPDVAEEFAQHMAGTEAAFAGGGIGAALSFDPTRLIPADPHSVGKAEPKLAFTGLINHVVKNGPAARAGFRDGDVITRVNGQVVTDMDAEYVVENLVHGPIGSKITVTVKRGDKELTRSMLRDKVVMDNVWSRDLGNGVIAIVVTEFRAQTAANIYNEVVKNLDKAKGFIIDVRGNPGGLLNEAILSASWFVHDGVLASQRERVGGDPSHPGDIKYATITYTREGGNVVVTTVDDSTGTVLSKTRIALQVGRIDPKTGKPGKMEVVNKIPFLGDKPVVILANGHSASAAELFTGAVSENFIAGPASKPGKNPAKTDHQGGLFVGEKTFGKFIGQSVGTGPMGVQVKATSFRYFSPRGEWLGDAYKHRIGLTPEVPVTEPETAIPYTAGDAQLNAAIRIILNGGTPQPSSP